MRFSGWAVAAVVAAAAGPASADWQWTHWGMSKADVLAGTQGKAVEGANGTLQLDEQYRLAGMDFEHVSFSFDEQGLKSVALRSSTATYLQAERALSTAFGDPVSIRGDGSEPTRVYVDRAKGNSLSLVGGRPILIVYRPIPTDF